MIHSTKAIALVLVSSASVLLGYHVFDRQEDDGPDDWGNPPATQSSYSHYRDHSHYYYYGHRTAAGGSGFVSSSGSHGYHGTSHGGFGSSGHAGGS